MVEIAPIPYLARDIYKVLNIQSNLDYLKCQGPQESFRIICSSNDRKREISDIFRKSLDLSWNVIVLPEFATSTRVFCEVIIYELLGGCCGLIVSYALQV